MKKKLFAMALCLLMVVAMAVPAFAETFRATPPYFSASTYYYSVNSAKALNAYTEGTPVNGTNVTTYTSTGSITQEWIANAISRRGSLFCTCWNFQQRKSIGFMLRGQWEL